MVFEAMLEKFRAKAVEKKATQSALEAQLTATREAEAAARKEAGRELLGALGEVLTRKTKLDERYHAVMDGFPDGESRIWPSDIYPAIGRAERVGTTYFSLRRQDETLGVPVLQTPIDIRPVINDFWKVGVYSEEVDKVLAQYAPAFKQAKSEAERWAVVETYDGVLGDRIQDFNRRYQEGDETVVGQVNRFGEQKLQEWQKIYNRVYGTE